MRDPAEVQQLRARFSDLMGRAERFRRDLGELIADAIVSLQSQRRALDKWMTYAESVCDGMPTEVLDQRFKAAIEADAPPTEHAELCRSREKGSCDCNQEGE